MAIALALSVLNASAAGTKFNDLQVSARKGLVAQEKELATAYLTGNGVSPDVRMAAYWYQRAAESGDPAAQNELGLLYQGGVGVPADPKRAIHWFQLAAASGFIEAKVKFQKMKGWLPNCFERLSIGGVVLQPHILGICISLDME
jgi:hypothetical protein